MASTVQKTLNTVISETLTLSSSITYLSLLSWSFFIGDLTTSAHLPVQLRLNQTIGPHLRILLCFSQMRNHTRLKHDTLKHSSGLLTWINPPLRSLIDTGPHKPNCPLETCMLTPLSLIACCLFYTQPMHMSLPRYVC